jgi:hypothetical protein
MPRPASRKLISRGCSHRDPLLEIDFQRRARYPSLKIAFLAARSRSGYRTRSLKIHFYPPLETFFRSALHL